MKPKKIECSSCGAAVTIDIKGRESVFCPYCGNHIIIEGNKEEINQNYNINITNQYANIAKIEREIRKDRENERNFKIRQPLKTPVF